MQESTDKPNPEALPDTGSAENAVPPATEGSPRGAPTLDQVVPEVMPSLEDLLKAAELKAAEHHDAWLRAKAETENVRRRAQDDIAKAGKYAVEKFSGELLAVKDSLEAAIANSANDNQGAENLKAGVELTLRQLTAAFEKSNLAEINPVGQKFDPHQHQAISQVEADGEPNTVISVLQKGYALHGRVIRPALVVVSKAKAAPPA